MLNIQKNISLALHTTFRIGGLAKYFVEVNSETELLEAIKYAKDNNLEFFILGGGSNLLVSDNGFDGIVIKCRIKNYEIQITSGVIKAGSGVFLSKTVKDSIENSLTGMEWAFGIPGTIGGAIRGNAGAFGGEMAEVVESVKVFDANDSEIKIFNKNDCVYTYRNSIFKQNRNLIILSAVLNLAAGNKDESQKKSQEIIRQRIAKQPQGMASAGSFFVNPVVDNSKLIAEFEQERGIKSKGNKIPAGWLIEKADLKGKKMGGAMISDIHPNYIVNTGLATAEDVIMLTSFIKQQVRDKFGIELKEEVQYLGF